MKCLHINIRQATFIILSIIVNNATIIQMSDNEMEESPQTTQKEPSEETMEGPEDSPLPLQCSSSTLNCTELNPECFTCDFNYKCRYGQNLTVSCTVDEKTKCFGTRSFQKEMICRYCYQTEPWEHSCELKANCNSIGSPRVNYTTNCTVKSNILCLGNRIFNKNVLCNWTGGYRWPTALILSITLGGFGADRFYLGHWQEGIGKLFSFGGLGVWTIIDVILISLHYLGPADGSLYI